MHRIFDASSQIDPYKLRSDTVDGYIDILSKDDALSLKNFAKDYYELIRSKVRTGIWTKDDDMLKKCDHNPPYKNNQIHNLIAGILHEPLILFLDEPTVGVDVQSKNVIISYLKELNAKGTTIIYTSHHLTEAQDFCTKIAIIDRGTIYAEGTPNELIQSTSGANNLEDVFISLTGKELRDDV